MDRRRFMSMTAGALASAGLGNSARAARSFDRFRAAEWGLKRRFVRGRFGAVAYVDVGNGIPALFLHGFPLNGFQWRHAVEQLALTNRCIVPDFLGLGASEAADAQDLSPAGQATMILALLDALQIERVHLVGNDSGTVVAQLLAARAPGRLRTLLLTNGDTERQGASPGARAGISWARAGLLKQCIEPWYEDRDHARTAEQLGGRCYADPGNPTDEAIEMYFAPLLSSPRRAQQVEAYGRAQGPNPLRDIGPALRRCGVPLRVVWGMADQPADADVLAAAFGNPRGVRRLDNAKLFWPEEQPDVIVAEAAALWQPARA